ncbi:MAG: DUF3566 domain-containing protein [Candidatus Aenigmarchaeota archaeon]|nr:DUF3566 domain-containing protein [Candidatus Aenigmarchaeota archaeon]MDI6721962.1 DUF3566 domain-containing protein [Candidatus Aenigmarchaeota archaeon]
MRKPKKFVMTRIGVLSTAKISAVVMLVFGFFIGLFLAVFGSALYYSESVSGLGIAFLVILIPIIYAIMGFIFGAISAVIYNFIAKYIGGIEFDLREK